MQEFENNQANNESEENINVKSKDRAFNFLASQIFICFFALCFIIVLKLIGGSVYAQIKDGFCEYFNKPINVKQVLSAGETRAVLTAQSTVYGAGGTEEEVAFLKQKSEISVSEKEEIEKTDINAMCIPVNGRITSEYSYRMHPITNEYLFHSGLDIGANEGKDILCALDGKVSEVDDEGKTSYGKYIVVNHSKGTSTLYAHCSKIVAKVGQTIKKGDVIAKVGSTGRSTGPHLHFEIRVNGVRLNPRWFADFV